MKAPRSTRYTRWTRTVCLVLTLLFLAGCSRPPAPTPEPPQASVEPSAEEAFAAASALRRNERNAEALQAFADFMERFPDSPLGDDARLATGKLAAALNRLDDAAAAYTDLIGNFPGFRAAGGGVSRPGTGALRSAGLHRQLGGPAGRP